VAAGFGENSASAARSIVVIWNLRLAAANRGIWKASELHRLLAARGLVISAGKMSGLWSGSPASVKLDDLDVICDVLGCGVEELMIPEPVPTAQSEPSTDTGVAAGEPSRFRPQRRRSARSLPPE
jgi:DNA-binding Xre family transcriptional regulator